jgi:SAM-dependent methyltransferase
VSLDTAPTSGGLRCDAGRHHPGDRWLGSLTDVDRRVLARAEGPVLDVGCGPARHTIALAARGIPALGIDITAAALALARPRGATVLLRSVFDQVPAEGRWGTVLLLDGNIGIGADERALLFRVVQLLRPGGVVLIELEEPHVAPLHPAGGQLRVEIDDHVGPWFAWRTVTAERLEVALEHLALRCEDAWSDGGRHFAQLRTGPPAPGP